MITHRFTHLIWGAFVAALLGCISSASVQAQNQPLSDRIVDYVITAELDPVKKEITGRERLRWRNPSKEPVGELQFHLYLNAFRDAKSSFMKESGGQLRGDRMNTSELGFIELTSMKTSDGEDLGAKGEFIHPDDSNADDRTVWRVALAKPVAPGAEITLDITFRSKLPRVFARTGYFGNYFFVGQWFPKIGVYEPAGMRRREKSGWNCHQFHANTEFYADFGTYDVTCVIPSNYKIGATGVLKEKRDAENGRTAWHFTQADVHDFAWTCSPDYLEFTDTFSEPGLKNVSIKLLLQPDHAAQRDRHFVAAKNALKYFGKNFGTYPYDTLTLVDPAYNAGGSGGMEYPTLITVGTMYKVQDDETHLGAFPEVVLIHEFGHQYWYGMVASNEFEESWMDEGLNTYTEAETMDEFYKGRDAVWLRFAGQPLFRLPTRVRDWPFHRFSLSAYGVKADPIITPAWKYRQQTYGFNSYARPALTLKMLERHLGKETMTRILKTYFERWRFKHPTSQDFFDTASEVSGQDLNWFFEQYFRSTKVLDYGVQSVSDTEAVVARLGEATMPVDVELRFTDGSSERLAWDSKDQKKTFKASKPLAAIVLDPDDKLWMDVNRPNNSQSVARTRTGEAGMMSRTVFVLQHLLQAIAFLG